jgi:hypothetical protein
VVDRWWEGDKGRWWVGGGEGGRHTPVTHTLEVALSVGNEGEQVAECGGKGGGGGGKV